MFLRTFALALLLAAPAGAQATLDVFPRDGQLYPRNAQNQASVRAEGEVDQAGWDQIVLHVYRDGALAGTESQSLSYSGGTAPFTLSYTIDAGLSDWSVELEVQGGGGAQQVGQAEYLTCGDAYLVMGQSNAVAPDYWSEGLTNNRYRTRWVRSFGTSDTLFSRVARNKSWYLGNGEAAGGWGSIGSWPLIIGRLIADRAQVPTAFINGAVGGRPISFFQRNDADPDDLLSAYGRALFRSEEAGIREHIRAVFWYQGESDGSYPYGYGQLFDEMMADWKEDYPALERVYVVQVRRGCGVKPHSDVLEMLRRLPERHPEVELMSTNGLPGHDGCHWLLAGYEQLALRLAPLVGRDFYGRSYADAEVLPPNPTGAWISNTAGTEIIVEFGPPGVQLTVDPDVLPDLHLQDNIDFVNAQIVNGNQLVLDLAAPTTSASIRYSGHDGQGRGWLRSVTGIGALSFAIPLL